MIQAVESLPNEARVVNFAGGSLVMPWSRFRATPSQLARMEMAIGAHPSTRDRLLAEVEGEMRREAKRRAKTPPEGRALRLVPADPSVLQPGDKAIYTTDEGDRPERMMVTVLSLRGFEFDEHRPTRQVSTRDGDMIVLEHDLEPFREDYADYRGAQDLLPAKVQGLPCAQHEDGGRVYAPDPFRPSDDRLAGVWDKFIPTPLEADETVAMPWSSMTDNQRISLANAADYVKTAVELKSKRVRNGRSIARVSTEELEALRKARAILTRLQTDIAEDREAADIQRGLSEASGLERLAMREVLSHRRAELLAAGADRGLMVKTLWSLRVSLRCEKIKRSRDGLLSLDLRGPHRPAAYWYRAIFNATERGLGSALNFDRVGSGIFDLAKLQARGDDQGERRDVEAKVQAVCRNGRGLTALRAVVGQGRTIRSLAPKSGASQALYKAALMVALDAVALHRGLE